MGISEDLKIVISGDPKKFEAALDRVQEQTKRLEAGLSVAAKVSGVAFAALSGTVGGLVMAFREQEIQEQKTAALLERTGNAAGITAAEVFKYAGALQQTSIYGDEVILESQNILLGLAKLSKDGFEKASQATLDLAAFMGTDLTSASTMLGKALANPAEGLSALGRAGIKFTEEQKRMISAMSESGNVAGAQSVILATLNSKYGGLAAANAEGTGKLLQLKNAVGDVGEEIGRSLTPTVAAAAAVMIPFFKSIAENEGFTRSAAATLIFATALTGAVFGVSTLVLGIVKLKAVVLAAKLAMVGFTAATAAATLGLSLVAIAVVDLALNWDKRITQMRAAWAGFLGFLQVGAVGLTNIIAGVLTANTTMIKKGIDGMVKAAGTFSKEYSAVMESARVKEEEATKKSEKEKAKAEAEGQGARLTALTVYLEQKKALQAEYDQLAAAAQLSANQQEELVNLEHRNALLESANEYRAAVAESKVTDQQLEIEQELEFQTQMLEMKNQTREAELNATRAAELERATIQQKANLQYIKDREKFGATFAKLNQIINSEMVKGAQSATGELVALQQSSSSTLKAIGKAAAIADITIKTAQSAMNIYAGFSTIPIVGPALGIAGAAAAVAFGAERLGQVTAAADGGLLTGGIPGKDSIPVLGMPGELITPAKNFDEVVNSVADSRNRDNGNGGGSGQDVHVTIGFADEAFRLIEQKLIERRALGV